MWRPGNPGGSSHARSTRRTGRRSSASIRRALYPVTNPDGSRGPGGMPRVSPAGYMAWGPGAVESPLGDWGIEAKYSLAWKKGEPLLQVRIRAHPQPGRGLPLYARRGSGRRTSTVTPRARSPATQPARSRAPRWAIRLPTSCSARRRASPATFWVATATATPGGRGASTSPTTPPSSRTSGRCRATSA